MEEQDNLPTQDELTTLKARADMLGIKYHPSIGLEKLREKVNAAVEGTETEEEDEEENAPAVAATPSEPRPETLNEQRSRLRREANELVRIRLTCMNPAKKEWEGELFTAGNSLVGSFTKFVPFNNDEGWYVPRIILKQIQQRECQIFVTQKDGRGNSIRKGKLIKEFAVEILPNLTPTELKELAQRQAMAKGQSID
jgi:hypothetical protein